MWWDLSAALAMRYLPFEFPMIRLLEWGFKNSGTAYGRVLLHAQGLASLKCRRTKGRVGSDPAVRPTRR